MQIMQPSISGKSYSLNVSLDDTPWAREMPVLNSIKVSGWAYNGNTGVSHAIAVGEIRLQTFINCENERFVQVTPSTGTSDEDIDNVIKSVNAYVEELNAPRSCLVDPATGRYPKPNLSEYDSDWI